MAKKTNTDENTIEDSKSQQEEEEKKVAARQEEEKRKEEEYKNKLAEQENRLNATKEQLAKAEGAIEAIRSFQQTQVNKAPEWSKEQWEEFEEKTGLKKETLTTIDNVFGAKLKAVEGQFEERAKKAEDKAREIEEKYKTLESRRSFENQTKEYLAKKPQFAKYEKDFNEFINEFPEETRKDPVKLAKLFDRAEIYIKGKVGEKEMRKTTGGSQRFGVDETTSEETEELTPDLSDLRAHERLTVEKILPTAEKNKLLQENKHDLKGDQGVMINSRAEWDKYKKK